MTATRMAGVLFIGAEHMKLEGVRWLTLRRRIPQRCGAKWTCNGSDQAYANFIAAAQPLETGLIERIAEQQRAEEERASLLDILNSSLGCPCLVS